MTAARLLFLIVAACRGVAGRTPCCGTPGLLGGGLRAGHCPGCGEDLTRARIEGAVPLLAGLASAVAGLGTAFLIAAHLGADHAAMVPASLAASLGTSAMVLPRIAGGLTGWDWALLTPSRVARPAPSPQPGRRGAEPPIVAARIG